MISKLENSFELKTRRGSYTTASYYLGKEVYDYICINFWRINRFINISEIKCIKVVRCKYSRKKMIYNYALISC